MFRWRPASRWLPAAALLFGWVANFHPVVTAGFGVVPGGPGDARLVHFSLEHAHQFLSQEPMHRSFWDPPIFFPARNVAAFTDTTLGFLPFYSPFRWLGASPIFAYQWWLATMLALTFWVAYRGLRRLFSMSRPAATLGAYVFAFAGPRLFNVVHPQMLPWFYWALAGSALGHLLLDAPAGRPAISEGRRRIGLAVLVGALVGQAYGAFYPFFFFIFFTGLGGLIALASKDARARLGRLWRQEGPAWALAAASGALLLAPLAQRYLLTVERVGSRPIDSVLQLSPRLMSWWMPPPTSQLYREVWQLPWVVGTPEIFGTPATAHGLGVVTPILALLGLWAQRRRPAVRLIALATLWLVILTTRWPNGWTLWTVPYELVPGASAIRALSRFGQCLILPASLGLAFLLDRPAIRRRAWLVLLIFGWVVLEQSQSLRLWNVDVAEARVQAIVDAVEPSCDAFYLDWTGGRFFEEDAMWAALRSGVPTINGRYGNTPPIWGAMRRPGREPRSGPPEAAFSAWLDRHCMDGGSICRLEAVAGSDLIIRRRSPTPERQSGCVD